MQWGREGLIARNCILHCIALHCIALHYITLHCIAHFHLTLHYIVGFETLSANAFHSALLILHCIALHWNCIVHYIDLIGPPCTPIAHKSCKLHCCPLKRSRMTIAGCGRAPTNTLIAGETRKIIFSTAFDGLH